MSKPIAIIFLLVAPLLAAAPPATTIVGSDGWLFFAPELRYLGAGPFWGDAAAKATVCASHLPVPPPAPVHGDFYRLLREQGVTILDLTDVLTKANQEHPMYCRTDTHWSGRACVLAAQQLAALLQDRPWLKSAARLDLETAWHPVEIRGDLARDLPNIAAESVDLRAVGRPAGDALTPVPSELASPVVLLGDSHGLVFHSGGDLYATGAGLPDQLAAELGIAVDVQAVRGSGATPSRINLMRQARRDADYLAGKKVVIWCFTVREFTESTGWRPVPLP